MRVRPYHIVALLVVDALAGLMIVRKAWRDEIHLGPVVHAAAGTVLCASPDAVVLYRSQPALRPILHCRILPEGTRVRRSADAMGRPLGLWKIHRIGGREGEAPDRGWADPAGFAEPEGAARAGIARTGATGAARAG